VKSLLLLAHPDDELFLLPLLLSETDLTVIFLTNSIRFRNSAKFLTLHFPNVLFLQNDDCLFTDGEISQEFNETSLKFIFNFLRSGNYTHLIGHNFEESHQDHDAVAAICERVQKEGKIESLFINLYTFDEDQRWLVKVRNGSYSLDSKSSHKWSARRGQLIWLCLKGFISYRKEWRVWTHLGPALLWSYLLVPRTYAQNIPSPRRNFGQRWIYFSRHGNDVIQNFSLKMKDYKLN